MFKDCMFELRTAASATRRTIEGSYFYFLLRRKPAWQRDDVGDSLEPPRGCCEQNERGGSSRVNGCEVRGGGTGGAVRASPTGIVRRPPGGLCQRHPAVRPATTG